MSSTSEPRAARVALNLLFCMACALGGIRTQAQDKAVINRRVAPSPQLLATVAQAGVLDHAGAVALNAGDYAGAEADERQSIAILPLNSGVSEEQLAEALDAEGKTQEALQDYRDIANTGKNFPRTLLPYALLLLNAGQWPQALAAYDKALPLVPQQNSPVNPRIGTAFTPDDPQPAALAAAIHVALGLTDNGECDWTGTFRHDKALMEYQKAMQLTPGWAVASYYYGYGLRKLHRSADAKAAFQRAADLDQAGDVKADAEKAMGVK